MYILSGSLNIRADGIDNFLLSPLQAPSNPITTPFLESTPK